MKKFFQNVVSSFVGAWIALVLLGVVTLMIIISLIGSFSFSTGEKVSIKDHTLLVLNLSGSVIEHDINSAPSLSDLAFGTEIPSYRTLTSIVSALKEAKNNSDIEAIYIDCQGINASPATANAIRNALIDFKSSKKPIYAYADQMSQGDYFIASIADSIFINPYGMLNLHGIGGYTPYLKGLLDKIGVQFQVVKVGTYKSAVEPYILNEMSQPARAQLDTLYCAMWDYIKKSIASSRNIKAETIDTLIDRNFLSYKPMDFVLKTKLIDGLCYRHEMEERIATYMGEDKFSDVNTLSIEQLAGINMGSQLMQTTSKTGDAIAVLFASGGIDDGKSGGIQSSELTPIILDLAKNDDIKGLVLRVNSPGGSAFGSEQIWEAIEVFKKTGKPIAVSMGDYAASGGYYISSGATKIFADPLTITGSIGIFGLFPNVGSLVRDKLGVNMELVTTNHNGMFPSLFSLMTPEQATAMQSMIDNGYELFVSRVAKGRKMSIEKVKNIGEGRVWDAFTAKKIGLIDEIGSLDNAIEWVAKECKLTDNDYCIRKYPEINENIWKYINLLKEDIKIAGIMNEIKTTSDNSYNNLLRHTLKLLKREPIQARMQDLIIKL